MKDVALGKKKLTEKEVFEELKEILREVAPLKIVNEITPESSLVDDFAFDSIDIMDTLLKIQERFFKQNKEPIDVDKFLKEAYSGDNPKAMPVKTICEFIMKIIY